MQALLVIRGRQFEGPSLKEKPQKLGPQTCVQAPSREILATRFCYSEPESKGKGSFQVSPVSGRITASPQLYAKFPRTITCVHQIFFFDFFFQERLGDRHFCLLPVLSPRCITSANDHMFCLQTACLLQSCGTCEGKPHWLTQPGELGFCTQAVAIS